MSHSHPTVDDARVTVMTFISLRPPPVCFVCLLDQASSIDLYNNDVGKESVQKFMKQTGDLKAATLYFAS
jgi:hypothetical protein